MANLNALEIPITQTPSTPPTKGNVKVYKKLDGSIYQLDDGNIESVLVQAGGFEPTIRMTNNAPIPLQAGFIVRLDLTTPFAVETFPQSNPFQPNPFGIVKYGGKIGEQVSIQFGGIIQVEMDIATVNVGDFIYNSATPGIATANNGGFTGAIGRALTSKPTDMTGPVTALINFFPHLG